MPDTDLKIKITTEAQLQQLRAMEAQFQRQIVQLRALGKTGTEELRTLERNLQSVRRELGNVSGIEKFRTGLGDTFRSIPVVGAGMQALNGSAAGVGLAFTAVSIAVSKTLQSMREATVLVDTANQLDLTSTSVQALNAYFGDAGIKAEQWQMVLLKLTQTTAQAAAGNEQLRAAFSALGLDVFALQAMRADERLAAVGRALADNRDNAAAAAASYQILGEQVGRTRNQLIDLGERGAGTVRDTMRAAGRATDEEFITRLNEAQLKLDALNQRLTNIGYRFAAFTVSPVESYVRPFALGGGADGLGMVERRTAAAAAEQEAALADLRLRKAQEERANQEVLAARAAAAADAEAKFAALRAEIAAEEKTAAAEQARLLEQINEAEIAALPSAEQRVRLDEKRAEVLSEMVAGVDDEKVSANALLALRVEELRLAARIAGIDKEAAAGVAAAAEAERKALDAARDQQLSRRLGESEARLALIDRSRALAEEEKKALRLVELERQRADLAARIAELERLQAVVPDTTRQTQIDGLRSQAAQVGARTAENQPLTIRAGLGNAAVAMQDQVGTEADQVARTFSSTAETMRTSMGGAFSDMILQARSFSEAANGFALSVGQAFVGAVAQMVADWIMAHTVMAGVRAVFGAKDVAEVAAVEATKTGVVAGGEEARTGAVLGGAGARAAASTAEAGATGSAWGFAAIMQSIGQLGPIAGPLVFAGALAGLIALVSKAAQGFAEGGLVSGPGTGTSDSVFARLSNGEYVMPAARVAQYGQGFFDELRDGRMPELPSGGGAQSASSAAPASEKQLTQQLSFFFDREEAMRSAMNSPAGRRMFVDLIRQTLHEI